MNDERLAVLARRFYAARMKQQRAKDALLTYRQEHGGCEHQRNGPMDAPHTDEGVGLPCFNTHAWCPPEDWCDTCKGSQPLWEQRRQTAIDSGGAMQSLLRACRKDDDDAR